MIQLTKTEEYWLKLFAQKNNFFESLQQYYLRNKSLSKIQFKYLTNQIKQIEATVELKHDDLKVMNSKEKIQNAVNFFGDLIDLLSHEHSGFKISSSIDLNHDLNLLDYEKRTLPHAKGSTSHPAVKDIFKTNDNRIFVKTRQMLEELKNEGIKYGRQAIPIYKDGRKKRFNIEYSWIMENLRFLKEIFEIRLKLYGKKLHPVDTDDDEPVKTTEETPALSQIELNRNLDEYQKYLDEIWIKTNKKYKIYETSNCPYCYKEILRDSEFCSYCGCKIMEQD